MTKKFCDICGKPAIESMPTGSHQLPDRQWHGLKTTTGSISPTEGNWTPTFEFHLVIRVKDLEKGNASEHIPDLCGQCTAMMIGELAGRLLAQEGLK